MDSGELLLVLLHRSQPVLQFTLLFGIVTSLQLRGEVIVVPLDDAGLCIFYWRLELTRKMLQTISHATWVGQPRHVHRITAEPLHIDAMIVEDVSIEAVVVPDLEDRRVFKVVFELHD